MGNAVSKDQMTPLERLGAYGRGEEVDRLPCVPIVGNTAARVLGVKVSDFRGDGQTIADAQIAAYRRFGYDGIRVFTDLYQQAEAMGAKVRYPEDDTAYLAEPAVTEVSGIDSLEPADPHRDGNLPHHLEAMERVVEAVGEEVPVTGAITGPFTNASFLIGAERLVQMTIKDPEAVHRLCELSLETALAYAEAVFDAGCTPSLTDALSSCSVIGPRQYREFAYPYQKRLVDYVHSRGKPVTLHICGDTRLIWDSMADTGADCLSLDNDIDLAAAVRDVGDRVRIMGNVHPSEVMFLGDPEQVRRATRTCVAQAGQNPRGYIVASGCSLPTDTPFANIDAMLDAVREIGFPVDPEKLSETLKPFTCSRCSAVWQRKGTTYCWSGDPDTRPRQPNNCPSALAGDVIIESFALYRGDGEDAEMARVAAQVEGLCYESVPGSDAINARWTRVEDTIAFAKKMGYQKIGIATCVGLLEETDRLSRILEAQGLQPQSVCCKTGSIDKLELELAEEDKVRPGTFEPACNPVAQARLLNRAGMDMNVIVGLCVGHDMLFSKYSEAPVTTLVAKDRVTGHNPAAVLYGQNFYYKRLQSQPVETGRGD